MQNLRKSARFFIRFSSAPKSAVHDTKREQENCSLQDENYIYKEERTSSKSRFLKNKSSKKPVLFLCRFSEVAGLEPAHAGVKVPCLDQLGDTPIGVPSAARTRDLLIKSQLLFLLSYWYMITCGTWRASHTSRNL